MGRVAKRAVVELLDRVAAQPAAREIQLGGPHRVAVPPHPLILGPASVDLKLGRRDLGDGLVVPGNDGAEPAGTRVLIALVEPGGREKDRGRRGGSASK